MLANPTEGGRETRVMERSRLRYDDGRAGRCRPAVRITQCSQGVAGMGGAGVGAGLHLRQ